ncbi:hypothetical protein [Halomonas sp. I5-271120]|uniref:hypothetical protein n=1 Tax=Halomonas sp. I5-271120 TaxID=3061632 RepID=UPI002714C468|nr:hypothetical protein [Halomonas sp. I5-271120]
MMEDKMLQAMQAMRSQGYAVALWSPEEIADSCLDRREFEEQVHIEGNRLLWDNPADEDDSD